MEYLPEYIEEDASSVTSDCVSSIRVAKCCCCIEKGFGIVLISLITLGESLVAAFLSDWINMGIQILTLILFVYLGCNRQKYSARVTAYQGYNLTTFLTFVEILALVLVYGVFGDLISLIC